MNTLPRHFQLCWMDKGELSYAAISRDGSILAQKAYTNGDFDIIVHELLSKVQITDTKVQFNQGSHRFFILHNNNGINTIIACNSECSQENGFSLLDQINLFVVNNFRQEWLTAENFSLQTDFDSYVSGLHTSIFGNADELNIDDSNVMVDNIQMDALEKTILNNSHNDDIKDKYLRATKSLKLKLLFRQNWYLFVAIIVLLLIIILILAI